MEDHILNTGNGLATRAYLDELWAMALSTIVNALRTHSVNEYSENHCIVKRDQR